jgi:hypothetical protein
MSLTQPNQPYERGAIFSQNGPFEPGFMNEAIRTLMRTMPIDPDEPEYWSARRMYSALTGLSALHPRDEIEVMLGVQAMSAYQAAAATWRLGMSLKRPFGESTRHIAAAASAARTFDSLLRAIERRQAKPLAIPVGRPESQTWPDLNPIVLMNGFADRARYGERGVDAADPVDEDTMWPPEDLAFAEDFMEKERIEKENEGLDIANTEGILPGGGMILPEHPTPQQAAYLGRRLRLMYQRERAENLRNGIKTRTRFRGIRPGDLIP